MKTTLSAQKVISYAILVEMGLFGLAHHFTPSVTCADCLTLREEFREQLPKLTEELEEWAKGNSS